jgi:hypothetical protein
VKPYLSISISMHEMFKGSSLYEHMELGPSKGLEYAIDQKFGEERALKMILAWARNLEGRVEGENHEAARKTILELPLVVGGGDHSEMCKDLN